MNRKLLRSVREYKRETILTPVFVALEVFMEVLIPLLMANIIDVGIANGDIGYIIRLGVVLVLLAMVALFFGAKAGQLGAIASAGYAKNLRHDIFYKIQDFSFGNIDHFSTPSLVTRLTTDITNVQMAYMFTIRLLARAPIMIVLSWVMTLTINVPIALLLLAMIPILGGVLIFIAKKAHPHFIQVFDEYDVLNNTVQENVNAARVVKAYVREDHENEKFGKISTIVFKLFTKAEKMCSNNPIRMFSSSCNFRDGNCRCICGKNCIFLYYFIQLFEDFQFDWYIFRSCFNNKICICTSMIISGSCQQSHRLILLLFFNFALINFSLQKMINFSFSFVCHFLRDVGKNRLNSMFYAHLGNSTAHDSGPYNHHFVYHRFFTSFFLFVLSPSTRTISPDKSGYPYI